MGVWSTLRKDFARNETGGGSVRTDEARENVSTERPLPENVDPDPEPRVDYILNVVRALANVKNGNLDLPCTHRERLLFFLDCPSIPILHMAGHSRSPKEDGSGLPAFYPHAAHQRKEGGERREGEGRASETTEGGGRRLEEIKRFAPSNEEPGDDAGEDEERDLVEREWVQSTARQVDAGERHSSEDHSGEKILVEVNTEIAWSQEDNLSRTDAEEEEEEGKPCSQLKPDRQPPSSLFSFLVLKTGPSGTPITPSTIHQTLQFLSIPSSRSASTSPSSSSSLFAFLYLHSVHVLKPLLSAALRQSCCGLRGGEGERSESTTLSLTSAPPGLTSSRPSSCSSLTVSSSVDHGVFSSSAYTPDSFPPHALSSCQSSGLRTADGCSENHAQGDCRRKEGRPDVSEGESASSRRNDASSRKEDSMLKSTSLDVSSCLAGCREAQNAIQSLEDALAFLSFKFSFNRSDLLPCSRPSKLTNPSCPPSLLEGSKDVLVARTGRKGSGRLYIDEKPPTGFCSFFSPAKQAPLLRPAALVEKPKNRKDDPQDGGVSPLLGERGLDNSQRRDGESSPSLSGDVPSSCSLAGGLPSTFLGYTLHDHLAALRSLAQCLTGGREQTTELGRLLGKDEVETGRDVAVGQEAQDTQNAVKMILGVLASLESPVSNLLGNVHAASWEEQERAERLVRQLLILRERGGGGGGGKSRCFGDQKREKKDEGEDTKTERTASGELKTRAPQSTKEGREKRRVTSKEEEGLRKEKEAEKCNFSTQEESTQKTSRYNSFLLDLYVLVDRLEDGLQQLWSIRIGSALSKQVDRSSGGQVADGASCLFSFSAEGEAEIQSPRCQSDSPSFLPRRVFGSQTKRSKRQTVLHTPGNHRRRSSKFLYAEEDMRRLLGIIELDLRAALENHLLRLANDKEERQLHALAPGAPGPLGGPLREKGVPGITTVGLSADFSDTDEEVSSEIQEAAALCDKWLCARQHLLAVFACIPREEPFQQSRERGQAVPSEPDGIEKLKGVLKGILEYQNQQKAFHKMLGLDRVQTRSLLDGGGMFLDRLQGEEDGREKSTSGLALSSILELTGDRVKQGPKIPVRFTTFVLAALLSGGGKGGQATRGKGCFLFSALLEIAEQQMRPLEALTATKLKEEIFWETRTTDLSLSSSDVHGEGLNDSLASSTASNARVETGTSKKGRSTCGERHAAGASRDASFGLEKARAKEIDNLLRSIEAHASLLSRTGVQKHLQLEREKLLSDIREYVHYIIADLKRRLADCRPSELGEEGANKGRGPQSIQNSTDDEPETENEGWASEEEEEEEEESSCPPRWCSLSSKQTVTADLLRRIDKCRRSLGRVRDVAGVFLKDLNESRRLQAELEAAEKTAENLGEELFQVV